MSDNIVLLARPSYFIVNEMQDYLKQNGYTPKPINDLNQLNGIPKSKITGAVISTAVRSDVSESYLDVLKILREYHRNIPVMFATLVNFETMSKAISLKLDEYTDEKTMLDMSRSTLQGGLLGNKDSYVIIQKDDITDPEQYKLASQILKRHFKLHRIPA